MRARESQLASDLIPGDLERLFPICTPGALRLGDLRRGARAAPPRRPVAAARGADDDPGGVGEPRRDGPGPPGVLRVPLDLHGAVGRPGLRHLHRRHRSSARSSTATACAPGRYWVTDDGLVVLASEAGVLDLEPEPRRPQGPAAARPDVPRRHRARPASSATTRSSPPLAAEHPYEEWLHAGLIQPRPTCPSASTSSTPRPRWPGASRPSATPRRSCGSCSPRWPARGGEALGSMGTDTPDRRAVRRGRG